VRLRAIIENQAVIMIALSRMNDMPITLGEDLRARARQSRELVAQSTSSPRSS
jgi:hypothetical protein